MDAELLREQGLPLVEYLTLMNLSETPGRRLRMNELAATCGMSLSGMSRVVQKLEAQGFVQRIRCEQDVRGWNAVLTDSGLARLEQAWPTNLAATRKYFLDHLAGLDLEKLAAAMRKVAT